MKSKTGWYNRNMTGNTPKQESYRHSLASKGIKTNAPKGAKGFSSVGSPTPNFDMVAKSISAFKGGDRVKSKVTGEVGKIVSVKESSIGLIIEVDWLEHKGTSAFQYPQDLAILNKTDMIIGKGIDFPMKEFHKGLKVETEHSKTVKGDPITIARIALDHLEEDKEYYRKLAIMESNVKNPQYDMRTDEIGDLFFQGASKVKAGNLKIIETPKTTQLVGYNWAVYGERNKKTGKVTFYKGWDKYSSSTSSQLTKTGLRSRADKVVDKRKEVGYDMSLTDLSKKLKKASKDVSKKAHDISKNIEKRNIERQLKAEEKIEHDLEVAKQQIKLKKLQAKSDIMGLKHKESVQRQRQELARLNKELEKGTTKAKAKELSKKAGKEGLKIAGIIAKGVAKEVKIAISTESPKKKKK